MMPVSRTLALGTLVASGPVCAVTDGLLLVAPVGGDAVLGTAMHLVRAHLDFDRLPVQPDDGGVQRLVQVELR